MVIGFPLVAYGTLQKDKPLALAGAITIGLCFLSCLIMQWCIIYVKDKKALKRYFLTILIITLVSAIDLYLTTLTTNLIFRFLFVILILGLVIYIFFYPFIAIFSNPFKKSK